MVSIILSRLVILVFGLLYPAYASYKAVKTKNIKEYVKWMMYWIVFALFTAVETFSDVLISWLPFYYEIKMIFVFWMLSPVTQGSSFLYKKFVHPQLLKREKEIDEAIAQARTRGYSTIMTLGHKGLTYATNVVVKTAIKGQSTLVERVRSYSVNDLRLQGDGNREDEIDARYIDDSDEEFGTDLTQDGTGINLNKQFPPIREGSNQTQLLEANSGTDSTQTEKLLPKQGDSNVAQDEGFIVARNDEVIEMDKNSTTHSYATQTLPKTEKESDIPDKKKGTKLIQKLPPDKNRTQKLSLKKTGARSTQNLTQENSDSRLQSDNRELEERNLRRERALKKDPFRRKPLSRSQSDATDIRQHRAGKTLSGIATGLSPLDEVEHEHSLTSEKHDHEEVEEEEVERVEEEVIYYNPRKSGHYTTKEVKSDPYATLPRTRSRHRPRLN